MEILQAADTAIFRFINITLANPVTDKLMPFITERNHWFIFYVLIWLYLVLKGGRTGIASAMLVLPLIFLTDQVSDNLIKPYFERIRPCHVVPGVNLLVGCTDSFSFPSIHAVNNFAAARLFSYFYPGMRWFLYTGAFVVALSRVMCGVHYPSDLAGGALIGIAVASFVIMLWSYSAKLFTRSNRDAS